MGFFEDHRTSLNLVWDQSGRGLRVGQLGAAWSAASHFTVSPGPIQLVLPTGVGKTAVMTMIPFLVPSTRVLVVTPSRLVRDQAIDEFRTLNVLRQTRSFPEDGSGPRVVRVDHRLTSAADWRALEDYDVVVGTPSVLSPAYDAIADPPPGLFDLVIIDEAHHTPAATWDALLQSFPDQRSVLMTATPFRRDKQGLPGEVAYNYPLAQALEDGVFTPISFIPVQVDPGEDRDRALAEAARDRLRAEEHRESRLLVRTDRIDEAERLVEVYQEAGIDIGVIHSRKSLRTARRTLAQLTSGEIQGVSSVGVLGEGFDFPALKIAVYHERHKSLPATLQFIGRIARTGPGGYGPAELLAIREDIQDETRLLYEQDAAWTELVPGLIDAAITEERNRREYLGRLAEPAHQEFSIYALAPRLQAEVFRVPADLDLELRYDSNLLGGGLVIHSASDESNELLLVVTEHRMHPRWMTTDALDTLGYELHLVVYQRDWDLLFVSSPNDHSRRELLQKIGAEGIPRVGPEAMNRLLHRLNIVAYSSVGMRSGRARLARRASYRMLVGSAVHQAVNPSESRAYGVGHLIGTHQLEDGRVGGIGVSIAKSKVWSWGTADLLGYRDWCFELGELMTRGGRVDLSAPLLPLQMPSTLTEYPDDPIAAVFDGKLINADCFVETRDGLCHVSALEVQVSRIDEQHLLCQFMNATSQVWACRIDVLGGVEGIGDTPGATIAGDQLDLQELIEEFPPVLYFADGSTVVGGTLFRPPAELPQLPESQLTAWDWADTDIRAEARNPTEGLRTIQDKTAEQMAAIAQGAFVLIDDAAYEIADLVVLIRGRDESVDASLLHCKFSSENTPGVRVADVTDVLGQAVRSARWTDTKAFWQELRRRFHDRAALRVERGDPEELEALLDQWADAPPETRFSILVVQPGLEVERLTSNARVNALAVNAYEWIQDQGAELTIVGS